MSDIIFSLVIIASIPLLASVVLYVLFRSEKFEKLSEKKKQLIAGILFGLLAVLATEKGVAFDGSIINVRDAAVVCAGLFFGPQAGILAGLIGGIERFLCVYWGGGYYTRIACTISTILAGFASAYVRKRLNENKIPTFTQATIVTFAIEIVHMLMIFVTNLSDAKRAFLYVEVCTGPMVAVNTGAVALAALIIQLIEYDGSNPFIKKELPTITSQLQKSLVVVVFIGFLLTQAFNYSLQNNISMEDTRTILYLNTEDAASDVQLETRRYMYLQASSSAKDLDPEILQADLYSYMVRHDLSEINLVGKDGIIFQSSNKKYVGFDMESTNLASEFLKLLEFPSRYIQNLRDDECIGSDPCKFAGVSTDYGFIEIGFNYDQYHNLIEEGIISVSDSRHVGETGMVIVQDEEGRLLSNNYEYLFSVSNLLKTIPFDQLKEMTVYENHEGYIDVYYMFKNVEGYRVISLYPTSEADFSRRVSIYLTSFMETVVFAMIFYAIFATVQRNVVKEVIDVKESLNKIAVGGDLDTIVDVRQNKEFDELSTDINVTVDKLKTLISEAKERIDSELQYAKEIQFSQLPSTFPPYPERDEFDIYALMNPAREVGGDFYDLYMLDDDKLAFVVADVSGKGIPASLFMMRAKTILKNLAMGGVKINDVFTNANYQLCEGNAQGMFVTAWMGVLNLKTGKLHFVNAGHNPALLRRKDGGYEILKTSPGFVMAGMEGVVYKRQAIVLEPGDELFLYTDGVVEATNTEKQMYGEERLLDCINSHLGEDAKAICEHVLNDVNEFYKGAEQFDDITELSLRFLKKKEGDSDTQM